MTNQRNNVLPESQIGPAERLLDLVLNSSAHLWHNRPGICVGGVWHPRRGRRIRGGEAMRPGLFVPAAVGLYTRLIEIHRLNSDLMAHFASFALTETDWRDLKVVCAALMLVQNQSGQPVHDDDASVAFYDDDYRAIGEAMLLLYKKKSTRMLTPKAVLRVAELLETPQIAALNRSAGFGDPGSANPPLGRWRRSAKKWLRSREQNLPMLEGLVKAGYKETIKKIARKAGYKPLAPVFFEVLGWKQKQSSLGHRDIGLSGLNLAKRERFDGLGEVEICETIEAQSLSYKEVVGRLPKDIGLTPAIMAALFPSLSDRDLRMLTPTLEELGLMADASIRARWEQAVSTSTDQRGLNIAKNVSSEELKGKLADAADNAVRKAVSSAAGEVDIHVMFLIDKSGSMHGAIEKSKDALSRILAGFPKDKLHIASFDTMGTVLRPKAATRAAVVHLLAHLTAGGGTMHGAAVRAIHQAGVRIPSTAKLVVIVVGDEAGENGENLAATFRGLGYQVSAMAMLVNVVATRGRTVQTAARTMGVPFSEVRIDQFDDPYQVPRVLAALLDVPVAAGSATSGWVERVMRTPILSLDTTLRANA